MGSDPPGWISTFPDMTYQSNTSATTSSTSATYRRRDIDMIATTLVMVQLLSQKSSAHRCRQPWDRCRWTLREWSRTWAPPARRDLLFTSKTVGVTEHHRAEAPDTQPGASKGRKRYALCFSSAEDPLSEAT